MKKLRIKNKNKFNRFVLLSIILLTVIFYVGFALLSSSDVFGSVEEKTFTVIKGDNLWTIAKALNSEKDTREVIYDIYRINNLSSSETIYPGQVLKLPIYWSILFY